MKSYPPFLLLPLLLLILVFEWIWMIDASAVVAPPPCEREEMPKPAQITPAALAAKEQPNQAEEKNVAGSGSGEINEPVSVR